MTRPLDRDAVADGSGDAPRRIVAAAVVLTLVAMTLWFARPGTVAFSAGGDLSAVVPARLFESRVGEVTVDGLLAGGGRVGAGSVTEVVVAGRGG